MAPVRFEIWTRPDTGTFTRKFPLIDVVDYTLKLGMFGSGTLIVPRDLVRLDDILFVDPATVPPHVNDVGTLIRSYVGESHLFDFYASRIAIEFGDLGKRTAKITGGALGSALERTRLLQNDWSSQAAQTIVVPDWEYGVGSNLFTNGGFENDLPSFTFENGNLQGWTEYTGADVTDLAAALITTQDQARTGSWSAVFDPLTFSTAKLTGIVSPVISAVKAASITVDGFLKSVTTGVRFLMFLEVGEGFVDNSTNGFVVNDDEGSAFQRRILVELDNAAEGTGSTDNTFQQCTIDADLGTDQTSFRLGFAMFDAVSGPLAYVDDVTITGEGVGTDPWLVHGDLTTFEISTDNVRSGSNALKWKPGNDTLGPNGPYQIVSGLTVGASYTVEFWVYHEAGANRDFGAAFKYPFSEFAADSTVSVPTATYTRVAVNWVADAETMWVSLRKRDATSAVDVWTDDASLTKGFEPANVGEILTDIIDDAAINHTGMFEDRTALDWLTVDFTTTQDSASVNWDTDVSLRLKRGSTYRRIIEQFTALGYEFDMRPDPADDTDLRLEAYNPDGLGTDRTAGDGGAIVDGFIAAGPLIRREPAATYVMVEGESLRWADTRSVTLEPSWGQIETYVGSKDQLVSSLAKQAFAELAAIGQQELRFTLQNPSLIPGVDYRIGDIIRVTPGVIPTATYRVMGITIKGDEPEPKYQISAEAQ